MGLSHKHGITNGAKTRCDPTSALLRLRAPHHLTLMKSKTTLQNNGTVGIRAFKNGLKKKLPPDSPVLMDLLHEPDSMPLTRADVLIPHYLQRLERELEKYESSGPVVLRS